jgi:hypothetical protein
MHGGALASHPLHLPLPQCARARSSSLVITRSRSAMTYVNRSAGKGNHSGL